MTTNYHTPIAFAAAADSAVVNAPLSALDTAITGLAGGAAVANATLIAWAEAEAYQAISLTRDEDGVVSGATVLWPDGSAGTLTRTSKNATWLAVDAYTLTHAASGKTVTQAAVTRNADGAVTAKPALTVS